MMEIYTWVHVSKIFSFVLLSSSLKDFMNALKDLTKHFVVLQIGLEKD